MYVQGKAVDTGSVLSEVSGTLGGEEGSLQVSAREKEGLLRLDGNV